MLFQCFINWQLVFLNFSHSKESETTWLANGVMPQPVESLLPQFQGDSLKRLDQNLSMAMAIFSLRGCLFSLMCLKKLVKQKLHSVYLCQYNIFLRKCFYLITCLIFKIKFLVFKISKGSVYILSILLAKWHFLTEKVLFHSI